MDYNFRFQISNFKFLAEVREILLSKKKNSLISLDSILV